MRHFLKSEGLCLRMIIARHFDPACNPDDIWQVQPGDTDREKAESCCVVCRSRGTMRDEHVQPNPVCSCGYVSRVLTKYCPECGKKHAPVGQHTPQPRSNAQKRKKN